MDPAEFDRLVVAYRIAVQDADAALSQIEDFVASGSQEQPPPSLNSSQLEVIIGWADREARWRRVEPRLNSLWEHFRRRTAP
jgi:hypothetical protein